MWKLIWPKFYPLDFIQFEIFIDFPWIMSDDSINMNYLRCSSGEKKLKNFWKLTFWNTTWAKTGSAWANQIHNTSMRKYQKEIICFQDRFIPLKYHKFWMSYEWFSSLCDILLPKKGQIKQLYSLANFYWKFIFSAFS